MSDVLLNFWKEVTDWLWFREEITQNDIVFV